MKRAQVKINDNEIVIISCCGILVIGLVITAFWWYNKPEFMAKGSIGFNLHEISKDIHDMALELKEIKEVLKEVRN